MNSFRVDFSGQQAAVSEKIQKVGQIIKNTLKSDSNQCEHQTICRIENS
jgi:hypothetical protein